MAKRRRSNRFPARPGAASGAAPAPPAAGPDAPLEVPPHRRHLIPAPAALVVLAVIGVGAALLVAGPSGSSGTRANSAAGAAARATVPADPATSATGSTRVIYPGQALTLPPA